MKVIFLDIDGVLNGYNQWTYCLFAIIKFLHLNKLWYKYYDIFDCKRHYTRRLAKIVKKTGAKIVISSSWRSGWYRPYEEKSKRSKTLEDNIKYFNLEVIGITPKDKNGRRGNEIAQWLSEHPEVDKFVILDDEKFNMMEYYGNELIITSYDGNVTGAAKDNTGLRRKHVKQAIKILNA